MRDLEFRLDGPRLSGAAISAGHAGYEKRMAESPSAPQIGTIDRFLLNIDDGAIGALIRVAIGFATLPAMSFLLGNDGSDWAVVPFLLTILLLLRIVPALLRKLIRFSDTVREIWAKRRRIAKQYDSYQWRKLIWIGIGLALYMAVLGQFSLPLIVVCATCLLAGAAGMVTWRAVSANDRLARSLTERARRAG